MPCNLVYIQKVRIAIQLEEILKSDKMLSRIAKQLVAEFDCEVNYSPTKKTYTIFGTDTIQIALDNAQLAITGTKDTALIEKVFNTAAGVLKQEKIALALKAIGSVEKSYQGDDLIITLEV